MITPLKALYDVGDVLECSAGGNPEPDYTWIDLGDNTVLSTESSLVLTSSQAGQTIFLQCIASNRIRGSVQELAANTTVTVADGEEKNLRLHFTSELMYEILCNR